MSGGAGMYLFAALGAVPPTVKVFEYLPYSMVFPRALAIVHSGGIGTLAQALAAGRPQLIVPVAFDQPDNARRTAALGIARTIPFRKATAGAMASELAPLLDNATYAARAMQVGEIVAKEDGARAAADATPRPPYPDPSDPRGGSSAARRRRRAGIQSGGRCR